MSAHLSRSSSHAAYVEDCNEYDNAIPGTRQTANIAAKRSKPDIGGKLTKPDDLLPSTDIQQRDDAASVKQPYQMAASAGTWDPPATGPKTRSVSIMDKLRTTRHRMSAAGGKSKSTTSSPERSAVRGHLSSSQTKEKPPLSFFEGRDGAARIRLDRPSAPPAPEGRLRSRQTATPSPQKVLIPVTDEGPTLVSVQPRTRVLHQQGRSDSIRPVSYHAGTMSGTVYMHPQPGYHEARAQPIFITAQPTNPAQYPFVMQPTAPFGPAPVSPARQTAYPFPTHFGTYPGPAATNQWPSPSYPATSRRTSIHQEPPIVDYPLPPLHRVYSVPTNYPYAPPSPLSRQLLSHGTGRSSPLAPPVETVFFDDDALLMPPPRRPSTSQRQPQRPHLARTSASASAAHPSLHPRRVEREISEPVSSLSKRSVDEPRPGSRSSIGTRQPAATLNSGGSRNSREILRHDGPTIVPAATLRHRHRPVSAYDTDRQAAQAEAYISARSGGFHSAPPTADMINQDLIRRRAKTNASASSETGSRAGSSRDGSDARRPKSSRTSIDKHRGGSAVEKTRKEEPNSNEITIRLNTGSGVQVDLKGDSVEGRTIGVRQSRDGGMDLSFGSKAQSRPREGLTREAHNRRYSILDGNQGMKEITPAEPSRRARSISRASTNRAVRDGRADREEKGMTMDDEELSERLKGLRTAGRSRGSSRSGVSRRELAEGQPF